jgi:hypothetical protein
LTPTSATIGLDARDGERPQENAVGDQVFDAQREDRPGDRVRVPEDETVEREPQRPVDARHHRIAPEPRDLLEARTEVEVRRRVRVAKVRQLRIAQIGERVGRRGHRVNERDPQHHRGAAGQEGDISSRAGRPAAPIPIDPREQSALGDRERVQNERRRERQVDRPVLPQIDGRGPPMQLEREQQREPDRGDDDAKHPLK